MPQLSQAGPGRQESAAKGRIPLWAALLLGIAALVFAILVITLVAPSLAGLLAPADPPFFAPATLLEHRSPDSGVDEWLFAAEASGCEVYAWYAERAELCRPNPTIDCAAGEPIPMHEGPYNVGYCRGSEPFGDFAADWEIYISDGYNEGGLRTRFLLAREVDWINRN